CRVWQPSPQDGFSIRPSCTAHGRIENPSCGERAQGYRSKRIQRGLLMSWGEELRIETPEQIDFNLEVAGPGSRFYAQMIDWTFKWLVVLGLLILVAFATGLTAA